MARKKVNFTVEEVFEEVVDMFKSLDNSIESMFFHEVQNFHLIALGLEPETYTPILPEKKIGFTVEKVKKNFPTLIYDIENVYKYAVNSTALCHENMLEGLWGMDMVCCDVYKDNLFEFWRRKNKDSKIDFLYQLAYARKSLDEDDDLHIKHLALLAGVDERTIRNLASAGAFEIKKSGSYTVIANAEARRWLNTRPDFKPTQYIEGKTDCANSATDFGQFIALKRQEQELTLDDVAKEISVELDVIVDLEKGIDRMQLGQISKLQNLFKIENNKLLSDYMEIFHWEEFSYLKQMFQQTAVVAPNLKSDAAERKLKLVK